MASHGDIAKVITKDHKILCAISGGPDSMAMFDMLIDFWQTQNRNTKNIIILYCDHQTRISKAAKIIQSHNANRCIFVKATRPKNQNKTEAAMRQRRYTQILKTAQKYKTKTILFGHNLTDRIESAFINMIRGCGIQGILGLKTIEKNHHLLPNYTIYRPLTDMPKEDILAYCKTKKIPYEVDPSNQDNTYSMRNKLRNDILKKLYKLANYGKHGNTFHQSRKNIFVAGENIPATFYREKVETHPDRKTKRAYKYMGSKNQLTTDDIYQLCQQKNHNNNITQKILQEITDFCIHKHQGHKYRNGLYFFPNQYSIHVIAGPKNFWIRKKSAKKIITNNITDRQGSRIKTETKYKGYTLQYITEEGYKKGSKTRSKRCINNKIPIIRRQHIPVIVKNKQIVTVYTQFIPKSYLGTQI